MANITFTLTTRPSTTSSVIPSNLQLNVTASIPYDIVLSTLGSNAPARRKVQNRLNQRARRQRQAYEKSSKVQVFDLYTPDAEPIPEQSGMQAPFAQHSYGSQNPSADNTLHQPQTASTQHVPRLQQTSQPAVEQYQASKADESISEVSWCKPLETFIKSQQIADVEDDELRTQGETAVTSFEKSFLKNLQPHDLYRFSGDDHLLSLMYYNVFRALASNSRMLGLDTYAMHADDYPSPFITGSAYLQPIPSHLRPTLMQQTVPHHPCFDIFPDPVVRDRGIANPHLLPHGMLCMTLAGRNTWFENDRSRRSGLVIWGPPEEANSWEVTEGFVASWGWLVKSAFALQFSTNKWRATRGEPAIFFA